MKVYEMFLKYSLSFRAEPLLARIQADRTLVLSPVFDKVNYYDLQVTKYPIYAQGFDWALWCTYVAFPQKWYDQKDPSQPGKWGACCWVNNFYNWSTPMWV